MTLVGQRTAIVSLGISCQTTHQLRTHRALLGALLGEELAVARMPFDWMIAPLGATAAMIRHGDYYPRTMSDLDWRTHPYWPRYECYFWHEELAFDHPGRFMLRAEAASARMEALGAMERRIFIVSNSQNALLGIDTEVGGLDYRFGDAGLDALQQVLDERFGASELYAIGYAALDDAAPGRVLHVTPDGSTWRGDEAQWAPLLRAIATGAAPPASGVEGQAPDPEAQRALVGRGGVIVGGADQPV